MTILSHPSFLVLFYPQTSSKRFSQTVIVSSQCHSDKLPCYSSQYFIQLIRKSSVYSCGLCFTIHSLKRVFHFLPKEICHVSKIQMSFPSGFCKSTLSKCWPRIFLILTINIFLGKLKLPPELWIIACGYASTNPKWNGSPVDWKGK